MYSWTGEEQPAPLKRQCHSCGRHEHLDKLSLCLQCREEFDAEMLSVDLDDYRLEPPAHSLYQGNTRP